MTKTVTRLALMFLLTTTTALALAAKDGYYRWKDDQGEIHFTQQPPLGRNYEFVESRSGASFNSPGSPAQPAEENTSADGASSVDQEATARPEKMEILPAKNPAVCAQARSNLQSLQNNAARIRMTDADGNTRFLTAEEKEQQRARAQEAIRIHCD